MRKLALALTTVALTIGLVGVADAANGRFSLMLGKGVVFGNSALNTCTDAAACTLGEAGSAPGQFNTPNAVAVDDAGTAYVADSENHRIQVFSSSGAFLRTWGKDVVSGNAETGFEICVPAAGDVCKAGVAGGAAGEMSGPRGIAVGFTGLGPEVYVSDPGNQRVMRFLSNGLFLRTWGKDVVSGNAETGSEICTHPADTCKAGVLGSLAGEFSFPHGLAVSEDLSSLFVVEGNRVQRFGRFSGAWQRMWGQDVDSAAGTGFEVCTDAANCQDASTSTAGVGGALAWAMGVAVDVDNSVYVADNDWDRVTKFTANGGLIRAWGPNVVQNDGGDNGLEVCVAAQADVCQAPNPIHTPAPQDQGEFYVPSGIAADADKNIYVHAEGAVLKFTETGQFLREWGKNVVASGPDNTADGRREICVNGIDVCTGAFDLVFEGGGDEGGEFNGGGLMDTAPNGDLWTTEGVGPGFNNRVQKFSDTVTGGGTVVVPASPATTNPRALALAKCKKKPKPKRKKCRRKAKKLPTSEEIR
jgi:DNA-binding beta-propeller fold protein YncE